MHKGVIVLYLFTWCIYSKYLLTYKWKTYWDKVCSLCTFHSYWQFCFTKAPGLFPLWSSVTLTCTCSLKFLIDCAQLLNSYCWPLKSNTKHYYFCISFLFCFVHPKSQTRESSPPLGSMTPVLTKYEGVPALILLTLHLFFSTYAMPAIPWLWWSFENYSYYGNN